MSRTPEQDVAPPDLPGYRFIKHIGAGGNAQVYLYEQNLPHRKVAVKVLNESALSDAARRRFTAEANVTADLAHRHIVQVFDANVTADGRPYIAMPYYPQPNLSVRARRSHFSVADVLRIGIQIGSAVETSHRRDVLHRDIKPQNILTDSYGEPALTDFGIATTKDGDGPEGLSVPWSPPEILFGISSGDQRSDVYSLGATLWHLLVGRSPFEQPGGDNGTFALMGRIKSDPPPRTGRADVPDSLERLLRQAMAKDAAARPQSAMELIRGLQSVEQELRLPLTHPILPADEPSGDTRGGDTIFRPRVGPGADAFPAQGPVSQGPASPRQVPGITGAPVPRGAAAGTWGPGDGYADPHTQGGHTLSGQQAWGQTIPPWAAAQGRTDPRTHGVPAAWNGGTHEATAARGTRPASTEEDPTRARAPLRVEPWGPREGTTMARAAALQPGSRTAPPAAGARPGGRVLAVTGAVLAAAVAAVAYFTLGQGHAQPSAGPTAAAQPTAATAGAEQNALGPGATAPGQPTVTAQRAGVTRVRFSWTYANHAAGDTFRWNRVSGTAGTPGGATAKPQLLVVLPPGQSVCVEVQVRRASGQASDPSPPVCWPN